VHLDNRKQPESIKLVREPRPQVSLYSAKGRGLFAQRLHLHALPKHINTRYARTLAEYDLDGALQAIYEYDQGLGLLAHSGGPREYYAFDGRGSVANITTSAGVLGASYEYDVFGTTAVTGTTSNPYTYNAERTDRTTGMQYLRARYYDPGSARFITEDTYRGTTRTPLTQNQYAYAGNNPLLYSDPSGHKWNPLTAAKNTYNTYVAPTVNKYVVQPYNKYVAPVVNKYVVQPYNKYVAPVVNKYFVQPISGLIGGAQAFASNPAGAIRAGGQWVVNGVVQTGQWFADSTSAAHYYAAERLEIARAKLCDSFSYASKQVKQAGQQVKDWASVAKIGVGVAIIGGLAIATVCTGGLAGVAGAALIGASIGGGAGAVIGGVSAGLSGGNILEGVADGFMWGVIGGAVSGGAGFASSGLSVVGKAGVSSAVNAGIGVTRDLVEGNQLSAGKIAVDAGVGFGIGLVSAGASSRASSASSGSAKANQLELNKQQGDAFEKITGSHLAKVDTNVEPQITIKVADGTKTKIDFVSTNQSGGISLTEAKSSATASLTKNQKVAFPQIAQSGGVVVGAGKGIYPGGTIIPPTTVNIVRP